MKILTNIHNTCRKTKDRKRKKEGSNNFLESLGIDLSGIAVQITLNPEDKELLQMIHIKSFCFS